MLINQMDYLGRFIKTLYFDIRNDLTFWQIVSAMGTVSVVIYAIFKESILARWRRPILEESYEVKSPFITHPGSEGDYYYHLAIKNSGKTTALRCTPYLDEIQKLNVDENKYKRVDNYISMPLHWVRESFEPTRIEPGQTKYINLFNCPDNGQVLLLFWFNGFSDLKDLEKGIYRLKIVVYSENAKKRIVWLDVELKEATTSRAQAEKVLRLKAMSS